MINKLGLLPAWFSQSDNLSIVRFSNGLYGGTKAEAGRIVLSDRPEIGIMLSSSKGRK